MRQPLFSESIQHDEKPRVIYKYRLNQTDENPHIWRCYPPAGAELIDIDLQNDQFMAWFKIDPSVKAISTREYVIVGTGWFVDDSLIQMDKFLTRIGTPGNLQVFHVFDHNE